MTKEKKTWAGVEIVEHDSKDNELREISKNLVERVYMLEQETRQRGKLEAHHANMVMELMERLDKLERLLRLATGPCGTCSGSGLEMVGCAIEGRQVPEPCSYCHGSGKQPLDVASMMEQFKEQARREVFSEDIPF